MSKLSHITSIFSKKEADSDAGLSEHESQDRTLTLYKEATREHEKALKDLCANVKSCMKSLDAVTASLEKLAKYTPQPHVVNGSAALHSGVKEILAGTALEELLDELAYSAKERYVPMGKERKEVREACKRRDKALGTYTSLRDQCNKLEKKKDVGEKEKEQYTTQCLARDAQAVEYRRYDTECSERYKEFLQSAGGVVLEDSRELTAVLHNFYSSLSYQFRKYEELLGESPCSRTEGLSQSNVSA